MLRTWLTYSVTLIATFIFYLCYKMWVSWFCLILVLIIPLFALAVSLISVNTLAYEPDLPSAAHIGDRAYLKFYINGFASFFSFSKIHINITDHMAGTVEKLVLRIDDNGTSSLPVNTQHCGAYTYKIQKIAVYDLFGFFHFNLKGRKNYEFLVKPVPQMPEVMPNIFGFKAKNLRKAKQPNTEIYDVREYQQGDPIKSIHWKISAKKDKVFVKEPLEEYGGHARILLKLTDDRTEMDSHLGQILFTSKYFLEREIAHKIRILPPDRSEISFDVENQSDLERALVRVLHMRVPETEEVPHEE